MREHGLYAVLAVLLLSLNGFFLVVTAFPVHPVSLRYVSASTKNSLRITPLFATKKKKAKTQSSGGGFGAVAPKPTHPNTISADKGSLERQWDTFTGMTDLEIKPPDDSTDFFRVVDVFVRCNVHGNDQWFRIGKVCTNQNNTTSILEALTLQKGLIFWTAVHMRRELVAVGGLKGAAALELGYTTEASMTTGSDTDGPVDDEDEVAIQIAERVSVNGVSVQSVGFRPDWNPPGFTYKRRESAARKKKRASGLEEIAAVGAGTTSWNIGGVESDESNDSN